MYVTQVKDLARTRSVQSPPIFTVCAGNTPTGQATQGRMFDLAPDGQRFLFTCRNEEAGYYTVTLNWRGFN